MGNRVDIMVDIETLGTGDAPTVFQVGAVAFNRETGDILSVFDKTADISKDKSLVVEGSTLKWWVCNNGELMKNILSQGEGSTEELFRDFLDWLESISGELFLWGNGSLFDNRILKENMEKLGLTYPIFFRNDRDMRTLLDVAAESSGWSEKEIKDSCNDDELDHHRALHDAYYQVKVVVKCYELLNQRGG